MSHEKKAIIIGAGPAGLTAAYELLKRSDIKPIILEKSGYIGGISRTIDYKGNKIDIGGHRFFSKSDRVMQWWLNIFPVEHRIDKDFEISYQNKTTRIKHQTKPTDADRVMLVRKRVSHIYYLRKFFQYPVSANFNTLKKLGFLKTGGILLSYFKAMLFPIKEERSLEDFFINRFGEKLYRTFFKDYTEKVWGISCKEISPEWGAQRIKKLSIFRTLLHAIKKTNNKDISQKGTDTSLIEQFLYPKFGPGQLWEEVARQIIEMGGEIHMNTSVSQIAHDGEKILSVQAMQHNNIQGFEADYFFSTMPVKELVMGLQPAAPENINTLAKGLMYRDFITVGLLVNKLLLKNEENPQKLVADTWIYIQEKGTKIGRLQIFNNWSPHLVKDKNNVWLGLEYFCRKGDEIWSMNDEEIIEFATNELSEIAVIYKEDVIDSVVVRDENTYPAYFGTYNRFDEIKQYINGFENLYLVGRNGMHKYNNSDHSMLTAMVAVDNIVDGVKNKDNIWSVNTEQEYHEGET